MGNLSPRIRYSLELEKGKKQRKDALKELRMLGLNFSDVSWGNKKFPIGEWFSAKDYSGGDFECICHHYNNGEGEFTMRFEAGGHTTPHYHHDVHEKLEVLEGYIVDDTVGMIIKAHSEYIVPMGNKHFIKAPAGATIRLYTSKKEF